MDPETFGQFFPVVAVVFARDRRGVMDPETFGQFFGGERANARTVANLYARGWQTAAACFRGCVVHVKTGGFALPIASAMRLEFGGAQ